MPALIIALVIALTTATGGGIVLASEGALPGDALYGVKQAVEGLPLALANSDEARAQVYLEQAARRVAEVREASERGRPEAAAAAAAAFSERVAQADQQLERVEASGRDVEDLRALLQANLDRQQDALAAAWDRVPDEAKPALERAMEMAQRGLTRAMDGGLGAQAGPPEGAGRPAEKPGAAGASGAGGPAGVAAANAERASAMAAAARAGDTDRVRALADELADGVEAEVEAQERVGAAGRRAAAARLKADLEGVQTQLDAVSGQLPEGAAPAVERARAATERGLAKAQQTLQEGAEGSGPPAGSETPVVPAGPPVDRVPQLSPPAGTDGPSGPVSPAAPQAPGRPELPVSPPAPAGAGRP